MKRVAIVGAAGIGRRCADIAQEMGWDLVGIADDKITTADRLRLECRGIPYLGDTTDLVQRHMDLPIVLGIGMPRPRKSVLEILRSRGVAEFPTLVTSRAHLGSAVTVGDGVVVCSGVEISTHCVIGDFTQINPGAIIGHDVAVGSNVSVNPGAIISGDVHIGDSAMIGAGAIVLQGLTVGEGATIGAGSVVTRDVAAGAIVKGNPAR